MTERREVLVIGAGPAGLSAGATLRARGVEPLLVDAAARVGDSWRQHYDRLHLHTVRWLSNLPGLPLPRAAGKWVARDDVARYLERYADHHGLEIRLDTPVERVDRMDGAWSARAGGSPIAAEHVVVATGFNHEPHLPDWPGRDGYRGELLHSARYRNPDPYRGKRVLVVGTGNSGAEIAVDLVEGGAEVILAVRTGPNIMRRDILGFPSQALGLVFRHLPRPVVDRMQRGMQRVAVGNLARYGMPPPARGVTARIYEETRVPILDVGLIRLLKRRRVRVVPAVRGFDGDDVVLADDSRLRVDAVIAATGFSRALEPLVGHLGVLAADGRPLVHGDRTHPSAPGLYFIGFSNPISGNLRELGIDARRIARAIRPRTRRRAA